MVTQEDKKQANERYRDAMEAAAQEFDEAKLKARKRWEKYYKIADHFHKVLNEAIEADAKATQHYLNAIEAAWNNYLQEIGYGR